LRANGAGIALRFRGEQGFYAEAIPISEQNVELARRNWELWSQGADDDEVARTLAPDVEWHHNIGLGTPLEGIYRGREEVLELSTTIRDSFGVARVEIEDVRDLSLTEVLTLGTLHLVGRGSGAAVTTPFGAVTDVRDGLVVRQRFWTDQSKALEAAG
jgi:ketosteroid isomerase-like protein